MIRLTQLAHDQARQTLSRWRSEPQWALDGTSGNGHDTLFSQRRLRGAGGGYGLLIVKNRPSIKRQTDCKHGFESAVKLVHASHSEIRNVVPKELHGCFSVFMFNLGYLPGSDRSVVTLPLTTAGAGAIRAPSTWGLRFRHDLSRPPGWTRRERCHRCVENGPRTSILTGGSFSFVASCRSLFARD